MGSNKEKIQFFERFHTKDKYGYHKTVVVWKNFIKICSAVIISTSNYLRKANILFPVINFPYPSFVLNTDLI